jgi:hypothetical protein
LALAASFMLPSSALAIRYNTPEVTPTGPEETVFDWSTMSCEPLDIPDASARAFRDASGRVQLISSHYVTRREIGPSLNNVQHDCTVLMRSHFDPDPSMFQAREWISAPYTEDGQTIYALVHDEYQGFDVPGQCPGTPVGIFNTACWWNAITAAKSTDAGNSYSHVAPAPDHLVATAPYPYSPNDGPAGAFEASSIVKRGDYYYTMIRDEAIQAQEQGSCLMRTTDLSDRTSWRAWDGSGFTVRFIDPYRERNENPVDHVCKPVSPNQIASLVDGVTWNTYFNKYLLVGNAGDTDPNTGNTIWGVYYSLSDDLIHWTPRRLLAEAELRWTFSCQPGEEPPISTPNVLDPDSTTRNFETTDQNVYLYFTRNFYSTFQGGCYGTFDRDLMRIPIQFSNQAPGGPSAALSVSSDPAVRQPVTFDASASKDANGSITDYRWDLDGDGKLETDTGTKPLTSTVYQTPGKRTVRLRVTDNSGNSTDTTKNLDVSGCLKKHGKKAARRCK